MCKSLVRNSFLIASLVSLFSCQALKFYGDADKPIFSSDKKEIDNPESSDSLNVVTFNIKKARKIQLAISEMKQLEKKTPVDIYLLQEMNEEGVEAIAMDLGLNYLYIPFSYDRSDKKNIGNAILTKGTIEHSEKLILPHAKWQNQQRRGVTIGEVNIHEKKILVLSVHTETVAMSRKMRMDQVDSVVRYSQQESSHYRYVLIGGDFNTAFPKYSRSVVREFSTVGFDWQTSNVGSTAKALMGIATPTNDYLFSRGFAFSNAYAIRSSKSSDHYPVFATLRF
jgi:endonuclease/exonuclease/phosphatase family metal-dependent hydrolase